MGLSAKLQIKPLVLSGTFERPENLHIDRVKYELSEPYVLPAQHMIASTVKTQYQNEEDIKTDFVSDKEVAAELCIDYDPPCLKLIYVADIANANN